MALHAALGPILISFIHKARSLRAILHGTKTIIKNERDGEPASLYLRPIKRLIQSRFRVQIQKRVSKVQILTRWFGLASSLIIAYECPNTKINHSNLATIVIAFQSTIGNTQRCDLLHPHWRTCGKLLLLNEALCDNQGKGTV